MFPVSAYNPLTPFPRTPDKADLVQSRGRAWTFIAMYHFNATVGKDGKLVNTKRGLQVSKHKFNGLSFVNSSACDPATDDSGSRATESRQGGTRTPRQEATFVLEAPQEKKPRRRRAPKGTRSTSSGRSSATASRSPSFESPQSESVFPSATHIQDEPPSLTDVVLEHLLSQGPSPHLLDEDWELCRRYFPYAPLRAYPYEDILTHNPSRSPEIYCSFSNDMPRLDCVVLLTIMSGSIIETVLSSEVDSRGYAYHVSRSCASLNRKLDQASVVDATTLACIAAIASIGVSVQHIHTRQGLTVCSPSTVLRGPTRALAYAHARPTAAAQPMYRPGTVPPPGPP